MRSFLIPLVMLALAASVAHPATIEVDPGLGLAFDSEKGTIGEKGGFYVADLDQPDKWVQVTGQVSREGDRVLFSGRAPDLGLEVRATFTSTPVVQAEVILSDTTGRDRGASVRFALPSRPKALPGGTPSTPPDR